MIDDLVTRFENALAKIARQQPEAILQFNEGANENILLDIQNSLGLQLPENVQRLYRLHNGQQAKSANVFNREAWLSLERVQQVWQAMTQQMASMDDQDGLSLDDEVQAVWWHKSWLPLTDDGQGAYLCVDLAPTSAGEVGQIIRVLRDNMSRSLEAQSLEAWLENHVEALEESDYVYSEKYGGIVDAEIIFAEEDAVNMPDLAPEQWQQMQSEFKNGLKDLLADVPPDLQQWVGGLLDDEVANQNDSDAKTSWGSFKELFEEDQGVQASFKPVSDEESKKD